MVPVARHRLDARQLLCPMPVIRTQNKIAELAAGDSLEVIATDPGALHDIPAWCRLHGHKVLIAELVGHEVRIVLEVGGE